MRSETEKEVWGDWRGWRAKRGPGVLLPRDRGKGERLRGVGRRACADLTLAVPRQPHPCARVLARGREEGRRPLRLARGHVTWAEEIGAAAARGGRLVQRLALTADLLLLFLLGAWTVPSTPPG